MKFFVILGRVAGSVERREREMKMNASGDPQALDGNFISLLARNR